MSRYPGWIPWRPWARNRWTHVFVCRECLTVMGPYGLPGPWLLVFWLLLPTVVGALYVLILFTQEGSTLPAPSLCPACGRWHTEEGPPWILAARYSKGWWTFSPQSLRNIGGGSQNPDADHRVLH